MTMQNSKNSEECYHISINEFNKLNDMFNDNKILDHCTFLDEQNQS